MSSDSPVERSNPGEVDPGSEGPSASRSRGPFARLHELRPVFGGVLLAGVVAAAVAVGWAGWSYRRMRDVAMQARFLPSFKDPPPGPRAPASDAFGVRVGGSTLEEVQRHVIQLGVPCPDTSVRALMAESRAAREREREERKRKGLPVDAVSGATGGRSTKELNPQVRLSCEGVTARQLTDRARGTSTGRLLFVFDSARHPLRHTSYQRTLPDPAAARPELEAAVAAFTARFGPPTHTPSGANAQEIPWLVPLDYEWRFADLTARVSALNFGGTRGIALTELVEVPLPLRPDAPTRR
jgi:hypothetical protein